jgi:hypothetical protein
MSEQHDRLVRILTEQLPTSAMKENERATPPPVQDPDVFLRQVLAHYAAHPLPAAPPVPDRKYATLSEGGYATLTEAQPKPPDGSCCTATGDRAFQRERTRGSLPRVRDSHGGQDREPGERATEDG